MKKHFTVTSHKGKYPVSFSDSVGHELTRISRKFPVHLLIDSYIQKKYPSLFARIKPQSMLVMEAQEKNKSLTGVCSYTKFLLAHRIQRHHAIVVIGGGQMQDIGSFTAHVLLRGISWIFIPTTLLAMADSCIGSKSAINVGRYKNQVGSFHPPSEVLLHTPFLKTLPRERLLDGYGEILKHAIIKGGDIYTKIATHLSQIPGSRIQTRDILYESLMVKKAIIEEDEFDRGKRILLNYGHTFGHALEGYTNNRIAHGVGVMAGMDMANFISYKRGLLSQKAYTALSDLLFPYIPFAVLPIRNISRYMDFLSHDKKVKGNAVRALLCRGIGRVEPTFIKLDNRLVKDVIDYRKYFQQKKGT